MKSIALPYLEGFLFLILCVSSCTPESTTSDPTAEAGTGLESGDLQLVVNLGRLRDNPSPDGKLLLELEKGQRLEDLGEVSEESTRVLYGSENFDEPWLKVRGPEGPIGWIYAREVAPIDPASDLQGFRRQKYLQSLFGPELSRRLHQFNQSWNAANTMEKVADLYRQGQLLRDTLLPFLEKKSYSYDDEPLPDLFWIGDFIPGFVPQLVAEGTVYHLFYNYGQWWQQAEKSAGKQDDRFFSLMLKCFPQDSIEYFYPAWELQTWDYGGHSLLGRGITYEILADIEQIQAQTPLFAERLQTLKDQILENITQPNIHFWEPDSLVKNELDAIIQANWRIFNPADRIALQTRRQQLDSAAVYQIGFNARAGGE